MSSEREEIVNLNEIKQEEKKPIIISNPDERVTPNTLTRFEIARILSDRAVEIENGSLFLETLIENVPEEKITAYYIARQELMYGLIPYKLYRPVGQNIYEEWLVSEMYYRED